MKSTLAKTIVSALTVSMALALIPVAEAAVALAGPALEIYGKVDLSFDLSDTDAPGDSSNFSLSSNESLLGLKGAHDINPDLSLVWQLEQEYRTDEGGGEFATRNTFAGFSGRNFGSVLFGYYDTPFKTVATRWDVLGNTVGDSRAILGAGALTGDVMNQRARNALLYMNTFQALEVQAMYATDAQDSSPDNVDDNDNDMFSAAAWYTVGLLKLSLGYEDWSNLQGSGDAKGLRLAATHQVTRDGQIGLIFESISADAAALDRTAVGVNGSLRAGAYTYAGQVLLADSYDGASDSGAIKFALGVTRQLDAQTRIYAAFGMTDNEENAQYKAADGGHGDKVGGTNLGGTPNAFSAGFNFAF